MTTPEPDWRPRARAFADRLAPTGTDPAWRDVVAAVPRHRFVPSFWEPDERRSPDREVDGADPAQRDEWLDAVYSDRVLVTRWATGVGKDGAPVRVVTSSASQPTVVAAMLDRLRVADGQRVLEIGTGTGYNAALLCARLGSEHVTSVDIDPVLVRVAGERLAAAGYHPTLHVGDGADPIPAGPPGPARFDRIIATCSVRRIPPAWIAQLAPGGRLVVPLLGTGFALAVLDKTGPVELTGRIDPFMVAFMGRRDAADQPWARDAPPPTPDDDPVRTQHGQTDLDPATAVGDPDFQLWLALHDPTLHTGHVRGDTGPVAVTVHNAHERADADLEPAEPGRWTVRQQGGRPWDTVEAASRAFDRCGRPARTRIGLTVRPDDQRSWLDDPGSPHTWPLPD